MRATPNDHQMLRAARRRLAAHLSTHPATAAELADWRAAVTRRLDAASADADRIRDAHGKPVRETAAMAACRRELGEIPADAAAAAAAWEQTRSALEERVAFYAAMVADRGGARTGAGRPPSSPTGERRVKTAWTIAPTAIARVEAEAARQGVTPSTLVERWALALTAD